MDEQNPPFLAALGLGTEADEREVRRAYARRLKLIDPATDLQAFQALREAYEQAQHWLWLRSQAREAEAAPPAEVATEAADGATAAADPAPAAEASQPEPAAAEISAGAVVFEAFAASAAQGFADEAAARQALESALADERLVNLEARTLFEWNVGCLLMNGWQPGHEFLFTPAADMFGWSADRRHLQVFGRLGAALDRAIDEKLAFFSQPRADFDIQRRLIQRLRSDMLPSDTDLRLDVPLMLALAQRYPNWLRAITSLPNAQRWRDRFEQLPDVRYESVPTATAAGPGPTAPFEPAPRSLPPWLVMTFVMIVLAAMARVIGSDTRQPRRPVLGAPPAATAPWAPAAPPKSSLWQDPNASFESVAWPNAAAPAPTPAFQVPAAAPASAARRAAVAGSSGTGTSPPRPGR